MGTFLLDSPFVCTWFKMKMFAVLALAAVAFGEPEPQVVYSGTPLSTVYNTPYTYSSPLFRAFTPYTNAFNGVYGSPVVHTIGKRDADAEPATVYTAGLPVTTYGAVSHVAGVNSVVAPVSTYSAVSPVVSHAAVKPVVSYSAVSPVVSHSVNNVVSPVTTPLCPTEPSDPSTLPRTTELSTS